MVLNREFSLSDQVTAVFPKLRGSRGVNLVTETVKTIDSMADLFC